jgi:hypothetical protein
MEDETPFAGEDDEADELEAEEADDEHEGILDRLRGSGVGTEDPNIIGDAGPTDIPPGSDPPERD